MAILTGDTMQLPSREGSEYIQRVYDEGGSFAILHDHFVKKGFEFFFERATVTFFLSKHEKHSRPALIGIVPSYVDVQPTDASHNAVGIATLSDGTSIATSVTVEHNPFRVANFTLHRVDEKGKVVAAHDVKTTDLAKIAAPRLRDAKPAAGAKALSEIHMSRTTVQSIVSHTYREILSDDFARPLYPEDGFAALVGQSPLVAKWAILNGGRGSATLGIKTCGCSCTCCNGCTTTSCVIEF